MSPVPPVRVPLPALHRAKIAPRPDEPIILPSGLTVTLQEVIWNAPGPVGLTMRFRFVAPDLAGADFTAVTDDMLWLCQTYARPRVPVTGPQPEQIVISLADRAVPFGESHPEVGQMFEAYSLRDGICVWEPF